MDGEAMKYGIIEFGESLNSESVERGGENSGSWMNQVRFDVDMIFGGFFQDARLHSMGDPQKIPVQFLIVHYAWTM
jgi:hypothetical protein